MSTFVGRERSTAGCSSKAEGGAESRPVHEIVHGNGSAGQRGAGGRYKQTERTSKQAELTASGWPGRAERTANMGRQRRAVPRTRACSAATLWLSCCSGAGRHHFLPEAVTLNFLRRWMGRVGMGRL